MDDAVTAVDMGTGGLWWGYPHGKLWNDPHHKIICKMGQNASSKFIMLISPSNFPNENPLYFLSDIITIWVTHSLNAFAFLIQLHVAAIVSSHSKDPYKYKWR